MGKYDDMKNLNLTLDERLGVFGNLMLDKLAAIQGYTNLLIHQLDEHEITGLPDNFKEWLIIVKQAADDLEELREVLIMQRK
jgi:hypothetical protein